MMIAIGLFALAAVAGLVVLLRVLKGEPTPKPVVFIHGALGATALVLLLLALGKPDGPPMYTVVLFVVAAVGGIILFAIDMQKKALPKSLALIHAAVAVVAFVSLLLAAFG